MKTKIPSIEPFGCHQERNWEEDFSHENGNYINKCIECELLFRGNKHRVFCKMCSEPNWEKLAAMKTPQDTKHAHAGCWLQGEMVGYARCMVKRVKPLLEEIEKLKLIVKEYNHPLKP